MDINDHDRARLSRTYKLGRFLRTQEIFKSRETSSLFKQLLPFFCQAAMLLSNLFEREAVICSYDFCWLWGAGVVKVESDSFELSK